MKRFLTCVAVSFAILISVCEIFAGRPSDSPVGTWEVEIKGFDQGLAVVTFAGDFTLTGYAVTAKGAGPFTITGNWGFNAKDEMVASFIQQIGGNNIAGTITTRVKNTKFTARGKSTAGQITWKAVAVTDYPDISGTWVFELKLGNNTFFETDVLAASTNMPSVFTIAGQGMDQGGAYPVTGAIIVNHQNRAQGISVSEFNLPSTTSSNAFSGKFKKQLDDGKFKGKNDSNKPVRLQATKNISG